MNVREKLVELLRNSPHLDTIKGYKGDDCTFEQGADWLIAHGVTVQEWVSVDDRLPQDGHTSKDVRRLLSIPADDVALVVHGHFVHDGPRFAGGVDWWHCSNCGGLASGVETRFVYCPKCGARMDGGDDGETD